MTIALLKALIVYIYTYFYTTNKPKEKNKRKEHNELPSVEGLSGDVPGFNDMNFDAGGGAPTAPKDDLPF